MLTLELVLQRGHRGDDRGVNVVQTRPEPLLVVKLLEGLERGVVATS